MTRETDRMCHGFQARAQGWHAFPRCQREPGPLEAPPAWPWITSRSVERVPARSQRTVARPGGQISPAA